MKTLYITLLASIVFLSCKDDDAPPKEPFNKNYTLSNSPEALVAHDASNYGIYKGVALNAQDSTATVKFNFYNNSSQPYALFYRNNEVYDSLVRYKTDGLGNMSLPQQQNNEAVPLNAASYTALYSSYNPGYGPLVWFRVKANGAEPFLGTQLYYNYTICTVAKEKSNKQVMCFEGSYRGQDSGRLAFVVSADSISGLRASVWNPQFFNIMTAVVQNGQFVINQYDDVSGNTFTFTGSVQNSQCSGTWTKSSTPAVVNQFTTRRTL